MGYFFEALERVKPGPLLPWIYRGTLRQHVERYAFAAGLAHGMSVLDAACGAGYGAAMLGRAAADVVGIDRDPSAVSHARSAYAAANVRFMEGDVSSLPFPDASFGMVVSFETIEHLPVDRIAVFLEECRRVLRPGGLLVLSTPDRLCASLGRLAMDFHTVEFTQSELRAQLSAWEIIELRGQEAAPLRTVRLLAALERVIPGTLVLKCWRLLRTIRCSGAVLPVRENALPFIHVAVARRRA